MKRLLIVLCALCMIFASMSPCLAANGKANGVLVEERVINLPNDQEKWYISVVGDAKNAQYQMILKWFDTNSDLYKLRRQVHYIPVTTDKAVYQERYEMNVEGLPTVRMQNSAGVVIYEAAGDNLPFTPEGLYGALANDVAKAQRRCILPWRREMERQCPGPCPTPNPDPAPDPDSDPELGPIDDGGKPDVPAQSGLPPFWLMLATLLVSAGAGLAVEWRATYAKK